MLATSRFFDLRYFLNMEKAILATLAYYDVLDLPLTLVEVASFLISPKQVDPFHQSFAGASVVSLDEIKTNLDKLIGGGTIATHDGFYFLTGRDNQTIIIFFHIYTYHLHNLYHDIHILQLN